MAPEDVFERLRPHLALILRLPEEEIHLDSSLSADLNAESIDITELELVLEEEFGVATSDESIETYMMGRLTRRDFYDEDHVVTPVGLERLTTVVPGLDPTQWSGTLSTFSLWRVLTVQSLCQYVSSGVREEPSSASSPA